MSSSAYNTEQDEHTRLHDSNSNHSSPQKSINSNNFSLRRFKRRSKIAMCYGCILGLILTIVGFSICFFTNCVQSIENIPISSFYDVKGDFIVNTENCQIPNINPFSSDAMKVFKTEKYVTCSDKKPLTTIKEISNNNSKILLIHDELKNEYLSWWQSDYKCCYKNVYRSKNMSRADMDVEYSNCQTFENLHRLDETDEFIVVLCEGYRDILGIRSAKTIYKNAYALINVKDSVKEKLSQNTKSNQDKLSVYFMGIDSISRLNLIRAMPNTYKHLESNGWFELRGYNKIDDNTFPNLMAILTGQNNSVTDKVCDWRQVGELENCEFMWNLYDKAGYVTAYAEDEVTLSTFNYFDTGFVNPPTDYYFRPLGIAAEDNLHIKKKKGLIVCLGHKEYADYIYDYGNSFAKAFQHYPKFGFFWTNSFSHEDLNMISAMDLKVKGYLQQLETSKVFESSIVFFFSDHGMRFGDIRKYYTGWLEERLPFLYIWLPESFQKQHLEFVQNLKLNRDRLTSPYDVHITLKHILQLSGGYNGELSSTSCPDCHSLFDEIPLDRNCGDAGISKHWCTCSQYEETDKTTKLVRNLVNHAMKALNHDLKKFPKCAQLYLKEIHSARKSKKMGNQQDFLISFEVKPSGAEFEATIRCEDECEKLKVIGSISRLNRYGNQSACIKDSLMRKYCYCI